MSGHERRVVVDDAAAHVRVVTIDRPPVNALDHPTYEQLLETFQEISADSDVRAAVLTATGSRAFCAGTDVRDFGNQHLDDPVWSLRHSRLVRTVFEAIYACPIPVIACVNGPTLGAGVGLVACCDAIIAAEGAVIGLPEINVGVLGGARFLHRLVPQQLTRVLMYTGRRIPFSELVTHGSVLAVVPGDDLLATGLELAREIAEKSPTAVRMAKRGLNHLTGLRPSPTSRVGQVRSWWGLVVVVGSGRLKPSASLSAARVDRVAVGAREGGVQTTGARS